MVLLSNEWNFIRLLLVSLLPLMDVLHAKEFTAYWNIPTFMCTKSHKMPLVNVTQLYGIQQNERDQFRGDRISILYDPGLFPALLQNASSTKLFRRNGGVPQKGSIASHLSLFEQHVNELIPDAQNDGLAIIDFESWRPVYRQNFGSLQPYKDLSEQFVRNDHPLWQNRMVETEAKRAFEQHGRAFMEQTIQLAQKMRPRAKWGYYGLPFCFNGKGDHVETCAANIQKENDGTQWLFDASQVIFPSVYMNEKIVANNRPRMVRGRVHEAQRMTRGGAKQQQVIAYHRYVFTDTDRYVSESDTLAVLTAMQSAGADGVILWGSSKDLDTKEKCQTFYKYLENVLGPVVRSFGRSYTIHQDFLDN